jgi:aminoglycoside phosphotransferase family enzyme/predicted kinase
MVGEVAYKLKKPVDLGFLDFRSHARRWAACRREIELNSRIAPDVYLGLAELVTPGKLGEPLVAMRRMPEDQRLSGLVARAGVTDDLVRQLARQIAVFHAAAPRGPEISHEGTRAAIGARWEASFSQCEPLRSEIFPGSLLDDVAGEVRTFLAGRGPLFEARIKKGRVLDGHGDLLAEDIFCLPDGPRILDCLDFDDRLRYVDQLDDVAFLAMDLEHLGAPRLASILLAAYVEYANDPAPPTLLHHFLAYRAFVRAKVFGLRSQQSGAAPSTAGEARRFAEQARQHLWEGAVRLVLVGGPPGTGKTTLAGHIADRLGMVVLSSDPLRKQLAGLSPHESAASAFEEGIYTAEWSDRTYAELTRRAEVLLGRGESVVLDASWADPAQRRRAVDLATRTSSQLVSLRCQLDAETADARIRARSGASDADTDVARRSRERQAAWPEATDIDTVGDPDVCADHACALVRPLHDAEGERLKRGRRPALEPD